MSKYNTLHYITNRPLQNYLAYIKKRESHYYEFSPKLSIYSRACRASFETFIVYLF